MSTTATVTMTGPQFDLLPYEEGRRSELLGGELISVSGPTPEHQMILQRILLALMLYFQSGRHAGLVLADVEFALSDDYRVRPDVLVLLKDRAAALDIAQVPVPGAPDIAVEIISPSERSSETQEKLRTYLRYGTLEVWQVFPKSRALIVHRHGTGTSPGIGTTIERGPLTTPLLPEFVIDVESLF